MQAVHYFCQTCEAKTISFQETNDEPLKICSYCQQSTLKKELISLDCKSKFHLKTHDGFFDCCPCCKIKNN